MNNEEEIDITIQNSLEYDTNYSPWCDDVDRIKNSAKERKNVTRGQTNERSPKRTDSKQQVEHTNDSGGS